MDAVKHLRKLKRNKINNIIKQGVVAYINHTQPIYTLLSKLFKLEIR